MLAKRPLPQNHQRYATARGQTSEAGTKSSRGRVCQRLSIELCAPASFSRAGGTRGITPGVIDAPQNAAVVTLSTVSEAGPNGDDPLGCA